jgi:hypothetical protein
MNTCTWNKVCALYIHFEILFFFNHTSYLVVQLVNPMSPPSTTHLDWLQSRLMNWIVSSTHFQLQPGHDNICKSLPWIEAACVSLLITSTIYFFWTGLPLQPCVLCAGCFCFNTFFLPKCRFNHFSFWGTVIQVISYFVNVLFNEIVQ